MTPTSLAKPLSLIAIISVMSLAAAPAQAQSTEEALGAIIGGAAGTIIGGEVDKKGSDTEGKVIGGLVGGTLGYIIGSGLDNDDELRRRHAHRPGEYYKHDGRAYRRYRDDQYGFVSIQIGSQDPYYGFDGRRKSHPVFGTNPGKGHAKKGPKHKHKKF